MVSVGEASPQPGENVQWPSGHLLLLTAVGMAAVGLLELLAVQSFLHGRMFFAFALHGLSSGLLALSLPGLLPAGSIEPWWMGRLTLGILALLIPILGALGLTLGLTWAFHTRRLAAEDPLIYVRPPELPLKPLFMGEGAPLRFSEGALGLVLKNAGDPDKRVAAVMALRRMTQNRSTPLLRIALRDPSDDVRLLAYALTDGIDQEINRRIQRRLAALDAVPRQQARLRKALAQDYWDLAFLGLASGDVETYVLSEAAHHLEKALQVQPDGGAALLLGRIRLRQRRPTEAEAAFQRARALGLPNVAVSPYRAEAAFQLRRFDEVRARLRDLPLSSRARLPLAEVLRFWLRDGRAS